MDAITLEVMRNRFFAITEEMGAALIRTAYSTNIKDRRDCSCALFDVNGETIAQAEHIPVHSGVLPWGVKGALKHINKKELKPGDAIMHNDPFIGGTHLPDIIIFSPIFFKGELVAFVGNLAHHVDVGGKVPGSLTPDATEIFHEGICFPPVKIKKEGKVDPEIFAMFRSNIRTKYESSGDLMAQIAANNVGEKRFEELCDEMGVEVVLEAIADNAVPESGVTLDMLLQAHGLEKISVYEGKERKSESVLEDIVIDRLLCDITQLGYKCEIEKEKNIIYTTDEIRFRADFVIKTELLKEYGIREWAFDVYVGPHRPVMQKLSWFFGCCYVNSLRDNGTKLSLVLSNKDEFDAAKRRLGTIKIHDIISIILINEENWELEEEFVIPTYDKVDMPTLGGATYGR